MMPLPKPAKAEAKYQISATILPANASMLAKLAKQRKTSKSEVLDVILSSFRQNNFGE